MLGRLSGRAPVCVCKCVQIVGLNARLGTRAHACPAKRGGRREAGTADPP